MSNTFDDLRRRSWDSTAPETLLAELRQKRFRLLPVGERLQVDPAPTDKRIIYLIKRHKSPLVDLVKGESRRDPWIEVEAEKLCGSVLNLFRAHGWPEGEPGRAKILELADHFDALWQWKTDLPGLRRAKADIEAFYVEANRFPFGPLDRSVLESLECDHPRAGYFRQKTEFGTAVRRMCPGCGRRLNHDPANPPPRKRKEIPLWPAHGAVDPDRSLEELIAWYATVEGDVVDGSTWAPGVTVLNANTFRQTINRQIAAWKLGDVAPGLEAQLTAHKRLDAAKEAA